MLNPTDKGFLSFLSKNRSAFYVFLVVALMAANVYQYVEKSNADERNRIALQKVNDQNLKLATDVLQYERQRSEKLEYLLNNLSKK
jgi:hypothetical protein